jgi:aromatic ring-opening dioxygenase catalytic subunit (LigB family)
MTTDSLVKLTENLKPTSRMPVLFLGHGNPMNAIENNEFTEGFRNISSTIGKPAYILCISAHWETRGTFVTAMERPEIQLSVPTPEHYLPLLYAISLRGKNEELIFFNDKAVGGSLTMTSLKIGN